MQQADMDERGRQQAIPLTMQHQPSDVGAIVNQVVLGGHSGIDSVRHHPQIDNDVDGQQ